MKNFGNCFEYFKSMTTPQTVGFVKARTSLHLMASNYKASEISWQLPQKRVVSIFMSVNMYQGKLFMN